MKRLLMLGITLVCLSCQDAPPTDDGACVDCPINLTRVALLGNTHGEVGSQSNFLALASGRDGSVYGLYNGNTAQVLLHDSTGAVVAAIGNRGDGPGEYRRIATMLFSGDTLYVFDPAAARISFLSPTGRYLGGTALPGSPIRALLAPNGRFVINSDIPSSEAIGLPLHVLNPAGSIEASFGVDTPWYRPDQDHLLIRTLAPADESSFWASHRQEYTIERWTYGGRKLQTIQRSVDWFQPTLRYPSLHPDTVPPPILGSVVQRGDQLWTLSRVADPRWQEGLEEITSESGRTAYGISDPDRVFDTIVEILDVASGNLIHSSRLDMAFGSFLADGRLTRATYDGEGHVFIELWRADWPGQTAGRSASVTGAKR